MINIDYYEKNTRQSDILSSLKTNKKKVHKSNVNDTCAMSKLRGFQTIESEKKEIKHNMDMNEPQFIHGHMNEPRFIHVAGMLFGTCALPPQHKLLRKRTTLLKVVSLREKHLGLVSLPPDWHRTAALKNE